MPLSIKHDEADRLARELSRLTGESLTGAIVVALRERLERQRAKGSSPLLHDELMEIGRRCASLPVLDARTAEDILSYDQQGAPV